MIQYWNYLNEYKIEKKNFLYTINKVFNSGTLLLGDELKKFEKNYCKFNKSKFGLGVANGTDALFIALKCLNIGKDAEVITVSNTAIPTVSAIINTGAKVKFADIGQDFLIDVDKIKNLITKKTKAIVAVHLFGQMCDMDKILKIAKKYKLKVIEDCAQATGATYKGAKAGTLGDVGCHSFYPTKILGAYGDGGFITTNDKKIYQKLRRLRFYGMEQMNPKKWWNNKYFAVENGTNSRLGEIQAAILNIKIKYLKIYIKKRREIAQMYNKGITNKNIIKPLQNKK